MGTHTVAEPFKRDSEGRPVRQLSGEFGHPASSAVEVQLKQLCCSHVVVFTRERGVPRDGNRVANVRRPVSAC